MLARPLVRFILSAAVVALPLHAAGDPALPRTVVGVVIDGPWARNTETLDLFEREIRDLARGEFDVSIPESKRLPGDWTRAGVSTALDRLLADPEVDLVIALGLLSSDVLCHRATLSKPCLATITLDEDLQQLPYANGTCGRRNLAYLMIPSALERDVIALRELAPCRHLVILETRYLTDAMPDLYLRIPALLQPMGLDATIVPVGSSAADALARIPPEADGVLMWPLLELSEAGLDSMIAGINARKLPSLTTLGRREVARGVLATVTTEILPQMARRVAVVVHRILRGEEPGSLPVAFPVSEELVVNIETARAIGRYPRWVVLAEAELIGQERSAPARTLTLEVAVREALVANRSLAAVERAVAAGAQSVKSARAPLLPQADASILGLLIDEDRAASSLGAQPEKTLSASASLSQVVFSEPALANLSIQKSIQRSREGERDQVEIDVARDAAAAYVDVLRARTAERVQKENVRLTRDHLQLARTRATIGAAGAAEVFRWESQIATNRGTAIDANARRNQAEMELNRVLHRPIEEPFDLEDATLDDAEFLVLVTPALPYFEDKESFRAYRDFMAAEAVARAPEIAQLDAAIAAAQRRLSSSGRAFWLPEVGLSGKIDRELDAAGAGSEPYPLADLLVPPPDETEWSVGLSATYPLLQGGARFAERGEAREELARLEEERAAAAEQVEERVRFALHGAGASYAGIREAQLAAEASRKNLELVGDSYARGAISLIDLLDAQNSFVVADEAEGNATHDFLLDVIDAQRASGRFDFLMSADERAEFLARLDAFAAARGLRPGGSSR